MRRKKSIRISLLLRWLLKQLPWSAHTYTYTYVYTHVYAYVFIIAFILFRSIKGDHGPGYPHPNIHHNRGKKAHESSSLSLPEQRDIMKIKVPAPCACIGVGDRRRSGLVSGSGSVMTVMKGLNFYISILPAYLKLRRAKWFDQIITFLYFYLYLKGLSTGDFSGVLMELSSIEIEDYPRESEISISYRNLLMILKRRGLSNDPFRVIGVIGDCDLGFRNALAKEYPQTRHQICWVHSASNANVLESMPKSFPPLTLTKKIIPQTYLSSTKDEALKIFDKFTEIFEAKYPKATVQIFTIPVTTYMNQINHIKNLTMTYNFSMFKGRAIR